MRSVIIAVTLLFCAATSGYAADAIYTWKDKNGVLNITDAPPPAGAVVLDVSPVTHGQTPQKKNDKKAGSNSSADQQNPAQITISPEKQRLLNEAAKYRKLEAEAVQRGKELQAEIEAWQAKSGTKRKRRRNNRQIKKFNERINAVNKEIKEAGAKAAELEERAAAMR